MIHKNFAEITNPETWDLSKNEDIIFTKDKTKNCRVLVNYQKYKISIDTLYQYHQNQSNEINFDLNPYLDELNEIVKNDNFKDITDQPNYFENMVHKLKSDK